MRVGRHRSERGLKRCPQRAARHRAIFFVFFTHCTEFMSAFADGLRFLVYRRVNKYAQRRHVSSTARRVGGGNRAVRQGRGGIAQVDEERSGSATNESTSSVDSKFQQPLNETHHADRPLVDVLVFGLEESSQPHPRQSRDSPTSSQTELD